MSDMPHTPATMTTAVLSWLFATLPSRHARVAADDEAWEHPGDRTRRLEAAIQRHEELRAAVHALLR